MGIIDIARKYLNRLTAKEDTLFTYSVEKQKRFLVEHPLIFDDFSKSWNQYLAQRELNGHFKTFTLNMICFPLYFFQKRKYHNKNYDFIEKKDLVYHIYDADRSLIPESLNREFSESLFYKEEDVSLNKEDLAFLKTIKKKKNGSYYFYLKILTKMAIYRTIIQKYQPRAIATCSEYSFTSSILTHWLEKQNIEHINIMHGEKLFQIRDSFARFSRYYVWDSYYKDLLSQLNFPMEQFIVEVPPGLKNKSTLVHQNDFEVDLTYYLANENQQELDIICQTMKKLTESGWKIRLRKHPRYTDEKYLQSICPLNMIEQGLNLEQSLSKTHYAVSLYSTVLQQAYANGIEIIIDDLKNPEKYIQLKELGYIMLNKKHMLLSELLEKNI